MRMPAHFTNQEPPTRGILKRNPKNNSYKDITIWIGMIFWRLPSKKVSWGLKLPNTKAGQQTSNPLMEWTLLLCSVTEGKSITW